MRRCLTTGPCTALWLMLGFCLMMSVLLGSFVTMKLAGAGISVPEEATPSDSAPGPDMLRTHDNSARIEAFDQDNVRGEEWFRALFDTHGDLKKAEAFRDSLTVDEKTE